MEQSSGYIAIAGVAIVLISIIFANALGRRRADERRKAGRPLPRRPAAFVDDSPGRSGPSATIEVDPRGLGRVRMRYSPVADGNPDPGEIVWTWVPYQEADGRGKDRPMLIVGVDGSGGLLAVQLTSHDHPGDTNFVQLGIGDWDPQKRPSWINISRVFRVHPAGMRRAGATLDGHRFGLVATALETRYRWGA